ncbi:MAG: phosphatidylglycerol lysyltransferase domain-containing protein [Deltaproteobacteria bacterium]|nr:phosphatidylglycerol lysyltransferase domain-containing protein [Deltaproteobacteria bacterium]
MALAFEPVSLERQGEYLQLLRATPVIASDYSYVNLWGWAAHFGLEWSFDRDLVWIRQTRPTLQYWAPVGDWKSDRLYRMVAEVLPAGISMVRAPEFFVNRLKQEMADAVQADESRGHWDYLYSLQDLVALKGNRFHKKKNLLNQFKKNYGYQYRDLDEKLAGMALDMQENWCTWRDCEAEEALDAENAAIARVLQNWGSFENLAGGALMVDGGMVAYTIGEKLAAATLLIHFEKGSPGYKGIYQAINQMFAERMQTGFQRVNREQDLDNEGLRKAKMSYNPVDFVKKYTLHFQLP